MSGFVAGARGIPPHGAQRCDAGLPAALRLGCSPARPCRRARKSMKSSAPARREWAAPLSLSPTMRRPPGGIRQVSPRVRLFSSVDRAGPDDGAWRLPRAAPPGAAMRTAFAVVFPALGLSYYRLRISEIAPPASTGDGAPTDKIKGLQVRSALVGHESVRRHRRSVARRSPRDRFDREACSRRPGAVVRRAGDDPLDRAADLDVSMETEADLDLGAMASFGQHAAGPRSQARERTEVRRRRQARSC